MMYPSKLKILLFGATRHTGFYFMQQALDAGHEVTAIIRRPEDFDYKHPNLKVVKGDVLQLSSFEAEVTGKDVVISTLGTTDRKPTVLFSKGIKNITGSMQRAGLKRIMCVSAIPLGLHPKMGFMVNAISKLILWKVFKNMYDDMVIMEAELQSTGLDWTVVRPPELKNKPVTGKYRVAIDDHLSRPLSIGRADVAHYLLQHITDENVFKKVVEIAY